MKITYLYHSGFSVELENCVLLFDYYTGALPEWDKNKTIYVFVSHKHKDHFGFVIFDLAQQYKNIHYFLGSDVKLSDAYLKRNQVSPAIKDKITNIGKNNTLIFDNNSDVKIEIETLRSTDAGVAFIVRTQNRLIYHAGDLNWWHWEGEPLLFNDNMEKNYKKEIDSIKGMHFDAAFVPLDPRLEKAYGMGMDYFLENVQADYVFPMHMWEEYGYIDRYKKTETGSRYAEYIMKISKPGQVFDLWNT